MFFFPTRMHPSHHPTNEDSIIKRTFFISAPDAVPSDIVSDFIFHEFSKSQICFGSRSSDRFFIFEVCDPLVASRLLANHSEFYVQGFRLSVEASLRTIKSLIPHNVTFGKPLSIGQHVMAANPTKCSSSSLALRAKIMSDVDIKSSRILERILASKLTAN